MARVTFFSCVAFGVRFGPVSHAKAETVTTPVDPLALHPPNDVREHRTEGDDIGLERPASQAETLRKATTTGTAERAFSAFMQRVTDYRLQEDILPLHARLIAASGLAPAERRAVVDRLVEENAQRVLNLIRYVAKDFRSQANAASKAHRTIVSYFDAMFPENRDPSPVYETASNSIQTAARGAVAQAIDDDLAGGLLDPDRLAMLLGGGPGAAVAGEAVMKALTDVLH